MDDTTAVVTGAAGGLGAAVARTLGEAGAHVVVGDRAPDRDALEAVAESVREAGGTATAQVADVRDEFDVERLLETAARESDGGVGVVVAAATSGHLRSGPAIDESSYAAFDDDLRTEVRGVFATFREAVPHLAPDARLLVPVRTVGWSGDGRVPTDDVSTAGAVAVARAFAGETGAPVGAVAVGELVEEAAERAVRWAATDASAETLDGSVVRAPDGATDAD